LAGEGEGESNSDTAVVLAADSLWSPQTIIGMFAMTIVAATIGGIFVVGDAPTISQTVGGVMTLGGTVVGFYFGSSRGSQAKDETAAVVANVAATRANEARVDSP